MRIMYDDPFLPESLSALGRNGAMKVRGINVGTINNYGVGQQTHITFEPIHSRGEVGKCWIDAPISAIPDIIMALKRIQAGERFPA